jgi:hypothetical protein
VTERADTPVGSAHGADVLLPDGGDTHDVEVVGHGRITRPHKHGCLVAAEDVLAKANITRLGIAVRDERRCCWALPETILVAPQGYSAELWEGDPYVADDVAIQVTDETVEATVTSSLLPSRELTTELVRALKLTARSQGCEARVRAEDEYGHDIDDYRAAIEWMPAEEVDALANAWTERPGYVRADVLPGAEVDVAATLIDAARRVAAVLDAVEGRSLRTPDTVAHLLAAGLDEPLVGLLEQEWFEAKGPYPIDEPGPPGDHAKFELACDVAAFANGNVEALLVIGLRTEERDGRDTVTSVVPVPQRLADTKRYRDVLLDWVFPPIRGLSIQGVDRAAGRLLLLRIPVQPGESRPFLVRGGLDGERIARTQVTIPERVGDRNSHRGIEQIHAALSAGEALLRGHEGAV